MTTRNGTCAICGKDFPKGTHVYFDATKRQGKHLAHVPCWDELRRSRGPKPKPKERPVVQSSEPLDPPF